MRRIIILLLIATLVGIAALSGCTRMQPVDFEKQEPKLVLEQYFAGKSRGSGIFFDRSDNYSLGLEVELEGSWDEKTQTFTMREDLRYSDGKHKERTFTIKKIDPHHYVGEANGFEGPINIEVYGNALRFSYVVMEEVDGSVWHLDGDDWMFLQSDGTILNRAWISKFGLAVGEVFISIRKIDPCPCPLP